MKEPTAAQAPRDPTDDSNLPQVPRHDSAKDDDTVRIRELVDRQARAWEKHDFAIAAPDWLPSGELISPGGHVPAEEMQTAMAGYFKQFRDVRVTVKNVFISADGAGAGVKDEAGHRAHQEQDGEDDEGGGAALGAGSLGCILRDHCLFLTRRQIQRVLTLPINSTNKDLQWLLCEKYLGRRYRADTFGHFQTPVYYLGTQGWHVVGRPMDDYKEYRLRIQRRAEHHMDHRLSIYDVFLKFILEGDVKRIIDSEDPSWQEAINFGNIPDGWIQFNNGCAFIEVDRDTERPIVLKKKLEKYTAFEESGGYRNLFPECAFKVLVFTTTEERIESLEQIASSDDIWFCTMEEFLRERLDHAHWFALRGFYALSAVPKKEV